MKCSLSSRFVSALFISTVHTLSFINSEQLPAVTCFSPRSRQNGATHYCIILLHQLMPDGQRCTTPYNTTSIARKHRQTRHSSREKTTLHSWTFERNPTVEVMGEMTMTFITGRLSLCRPIFRCGPNPSHT